MSRRSFLASVTSLVSNTSDADNQTLASTANESTVALIPKAKPDEGTRQSASGATDTSTASASTSSGANDGSPSAKPQEKDWEAAFAKLSSTMGFTGAAPTIPQAPKSYGGKTSSKKKKSAKTNEQATAASSSSSSQRSDESNQTASSEQATSNNAP